MAGRQQISREQMPKRLQPWVIRRKDEQARFDKYRQHHPSCMLGTGYPEEFVGAYVMIHLYDRWRRTVPSRQTGKKPEAAKDEMPGSDVLGVNDVHATRGVIADDIMGAKIADAHAARQRELHDRPRCRVHQPLQLASVSNGAQPQHQPAAPSQVTPAGIEFCDLMAECDPELDRSERRSRGYVLVEMSHPIAKIDQVNIVPLRSCHPIE